MCHRCFERADRQGVLDAVALPKLSPSEVSRLALAAKHTPKDPPMPPRRSTKPADLVLRENPDTTSKLCRIRGCGKPVKARGFCATCAERVRHAGRLDELGLPPRVGAPNTRPKPTLPRLDADEPLQQIRVILGCDPDGADQEVVDKARLFVEFRDGVESAVNAAGIPGFMLLHDLVNAVSAIAGDRDRARDEVEHLRALRDDLLAVTGSTHWEQDPDRTREGLVRAVLELKGKSVELAEAHAALDAMPASSAPDCDTPARRIRYATSAWLDERKEASHLATLCQEAHSALSLAGTPNEGTPAERIHRLSVELGRMVDHIQDAHDALGAAGVPNEGTPSARIRALALRAESADIELDLHQLRLALGVDARCSDVATIGAACRMLRGLRSVRYLLGALDAAGPESARHIIAAMTAEVGE